MRIAVRAVAVVTAALVPSTALACLWDYDTLQVERSRFPDALELITGKFLRHSTEFYEWRIRDRREKLERDPGNLAYHDDLAVAYEKTGRHDDAIATILAKDRIKPGLYETEANLGTFLIHAGRLEEGLAHIDRAIQINPDAHFGREKYQAALVRYVIARRKNDPRRLPLMDYKVSVSTGPGVRIRDVSLGDDFGAFLRKEGLDGPAAVKGVLGMMRFGHFDSPVLLEALGSVLTTAPYGGGDAKRLAARAYLKASYEAPDPAAKAAYQDVAREALRMQTVHPGTQQTLKLEQLEQDFQGELADARKWYDRLRRSELSWIQSSDDPEREFARRYAEEPQVDSPEDAPDWTLKPGLPRAVLVGGLVALGVLVLTPVVLAVLGRMSHRKTPTPDPKPE